jgi:hypothetical protein
MKKMTRLLAGVCAMLLLPLFVASAAPDAQHGVRVEVQEVKVLRTIGPDPVLTVSRPKTAGSRFEISGSDTTYLQYSSIVPRRGQTRKITVQALDPEILGRVGTILVTASSATSGKGALGSGLKVALDGSVQVLVVDVGTGFTGTGADDGVQLTYEVIPDSRQIGSLAVGEYPLRLRFAMVAEGG